MFGVILDCGLVAVGESDRVNVLVAPAGEVHNYYFILWKGLCQLRCVIERMGRLEGRDNAFGLA